MTNHFNLLVLYSFRMGVITLDPTDKTTDTTGKSPLTPSGSTPTSTEEPGTVGAISSTPTASTPTGQVPTAGAPTPAPSSVPADKLSTTPADTTGTSLDTEPAAASTGVTSTSDDEEEAGGEGPAGGLGTAG